MLARGTGGWPEQARCLSSQSSHPKRERDVSTKPHAQERTLTGGGRKHGYKGGRRDVVEIEEAGRSRPGKGKLLLQSGEEQALPQ